MSDDESARKRWIRETGEATPLAIKITYMVGRIAGEVANNISLETMGRQLRDTLTDEELGSLVVAALWAGGADEDAVEAQQKIQADKARELGARHSKAGRHHLVSWETLSKAVFGGLVRRRDDFLHVQSAYRDGYHEAVEWRPLDKPHLTSTAELGWEIKKGPEGFVYRPQRNGFPLPWALAVEAACALPGQ